MLKSELIRMLSQNRPGISLETAQHIVDTLFEEMSAALARGDRIELRDFGSFACVATKPTMKRNPRNGDPAPRPAGRKVRFRTGKGMFRRMQGGVS